MGSLGSPTPSTNAASLYGTKSAHSAADSELASESRLLAAVFDTMPECIKVVAANGRLLRMNPAGLQMIGAPDAETVLGLPVIDLVAPEHRAEWQANHEMVCSGQKLSWEFDIIGLNGTRRHMETHAAPCPMPDSAIGHIAITHDITRRKQAERQQHLLIDELNHRVKNTLAIVQSIAAQTFRSHAQAYRWFEGRLIALAEAHDLLTRESWEGARIHDIIGRALGPHRLGENRIVLTGPDIRVTPKMAVSLVLAAHELATNAVKYGALSVDTGRIDLAWRDYRTDGAARMNLRWAETGGPPVKKPRRKGFGTRLIQDGLAREFKGTVSMDFAPGGLICTIDAPLT